VVVMLPAVYATPIVPAIGLCEIQINLISSRARDCGPAWVDRFAGRVIVVLPH
jgi:hypothetical protein